MCRTGRAYQKSPDGQSVAVSTEAGQIIVVDTETQEVIATYASHAMAVRTISWSPDSQVSYLSLRRLDQLMVSGYILERMISELSYMMLGLDQRLEQEEKVKEL